MRKFHAAARRVIALSAITTVASLGSAYAGTTSGETTISTAGSTALKNWFVKNTTTFTDIQPGTSMSIGGVLYPSSNTSGGGTGLGTGEWAVNGGSAYAYQLAPSNLTGSNAVLTEGTTLDHAPAVRFEYHESGSVEGILEMANDQIAPVTYVTQNVNRDPNTGNGVWVNYNEFGGGANAWNATSGGSVNGYNLGNFYANGQSFTLGGSAQPNFNLSGGNVNGGQNAVQMAISDAIPLQVFAADNTASTSATPWTSMPQNSGYGQGNTKLGTAPLGTASLRAVYQSTASLNMSAGAINPRTGTTFGTGGWNSAELNNLTTQTVATTATLFVANPGTGLTQVDRTDAQWLETTGRLQNGAAFDMTTRDVNSGTRNVSSLETGIDPTWSVGVDDDGNGNAADGGSNQITIGAGLRFSNKTAGGGELRPTVQSSRMAVGTLSINDASGYTVNAKNNPIRALEYSDSTDGSSPYVLANYSTISTGQYTIFQNEQVVTLKAADGNYGNSGSAYGTNSPNIQGDDGTGDVKSLINNTLNSVAAYNGSNAASPAAGLMAQGFIIPQLMQVTKAQNGLNQAGLPSQIVSNPNYNASYGVGSAYTSLINTLNSGDPNTVTSGTSSLYGANSVYSSGVNASNFGGNGFVDQIAVTSANYLFGNFNQNGIRDFSSAVVTAQQAQAALDASGASNSAFNGSSNKTVIATGISALTAMPSQNGTASTSNTTGTGATKGDLIVMGDYNGDGVFDGRDLYDMAIGSSLSDATNRPVLTYSAGVASITPGTGTVTVPSGKTFGQVIASTVLNKNVALDYLQADATAGQKQEARAVLTSTTGTTAASIPAGATFVGNEGTNGLATFTFDPSGTNAFNKSDVNNDGVVDFNDALAVDALNGKSFTNQSDALTATIPAPITGTSELANLVLAQQIDTNSSIGASDLAVVNSALTGAGTTNWYGYAANKTGSGNIIFNRSSSAVNVYAGASLNISSGVIQVASTIDPFTQNSNSSNPASTSDTSRSVAITVPTGGTLQYSGGVTAGAATSGIQLQRLSSLNLSGGSVTITAATNHTNRTLLLTGALTLSGASNLDLGNSDLVVQNGSFSTIDNLVKAGFANGSWQASGAIDSSAAHTDPSHLTALGVIQNSATGAASGAALIGSFDGVTSTSSDVLVKYTYYGDTNLDGKVDASDYSRIDSAFLSSGTLTGWYNGDFNYDGVVNGSDYTLIDNAFNTQGSNLTTAAEFADPQATPTAEVSGIAGSSPVPEPSTLGLFTVIAGSLLSRRRRRA